MGKKKIEWRRIVCVSAFVSSVDFLLSLTLAQHNSACPLRSHAEPNADKMPLINFDDRTKSDLKVCGTMSTDFFAQFCKIALDFLKSGANLPISHINDVVKQI